MSRQPKLKPIKHALRERILAMPVPGIIELSETEWRPSEPWIRKIPGVDLSVRRPNNKFYIFRIG